MLQAFNHLSRLMPWSPPAAASARRLRRQRLSAAGAYSFEDPKPLPALAEELAESSPGCGWFDSSHELQSGLRVLEHAGLETLVEEMAPGAWLDLYLVLPPAAGIQTASRPA